MEFWCGAVRNVIVLLAQGEKKKRKEKKKETQRTDSVSCNIYTDKCVHLGSVNSPVLGCCCFFFFYASSSSLYKSANL